jgi:hypothetical protein
VDHGNLVFCCAEGTPYSKDALNWQFGKLTRRAGLGHGTRTRDGTPQCRS